MIVSLPLDHEEINVVHFAVGAFHVDAGEIFVPAQAREAIIVNFDQFQREILAVVRHMKLLVGRFRCEPLMNSFSPAETLDIVASVIAA